MQDASNNPAIAKIERRGEMIQLGVAAASAAGLLTVLALESLDRYLWWAGIFFCIGIPTGLGRALMSFTAQVAGVFIHPVGWLLYPLGIVSCVATAVGYILVCYHLSYIHGAVFLALSVLSLVWMIVHSRVVRRTRIAQISKDRDS